MYSLFSCFFNSDQPTLWLHPMSVIKADVPHQVECRSPTLHPTNDLSMWLTVDRKHLPQSLNITPDPVSDKLYYNARFMVTFDKTDNQKNISCSVKWRNKTYSSEYEKIDVFCKYEISENKPFSALLSSIKALFKT